MKKTDEEKRKELEKEFELVTTGREMETIEKLHKKELKKYHNNQN